MSQASKSILRQNFRTLLLRASCRQLQARGSESVRWRTGSLYSRDGHLAFGWQFLLQIECQLPIAIHISAPDHHVDSVLNCIATLFRIFPVAITEIPRVTH